MYLNGTITLRLIYIPQFMRLIRECEQLCERSSSLRFGMVHLLKSEFLPHCIFPLISMLLPHAKNLVPAKYQQISITYCTWSIQKTKSSGPWWGHGDYQSLPASIHASHLGISSHFSIFFCGRRQPQNSPGHRRPRPGVPLDATFTSLVHCREAANAARRLTLIVHRTFTEGSKSAFIPLHWP